MKHLIPWIFGIAVMLCAIAFLVLWQDERDRQRRSDEEYQKYFRRLDDADKPN
jgi:protein-S-isoprenylcysteine O-methyltransferase Ste14